MRCPSVAVGIEQRSVVDPSIGRRDDEGQEDEAGEKGVEKQDWYHSVVAQ